MNAPELPDLPPLFVFPTIKNPPTNFNFLELAYNTWASKVTKKEAYSMEKNDFALEHVPHSKYKNNRKKGKLHKGTGVYFALGHFSPQTDGPPPDSLSNETTTLLLNLGNRINTFKSMGMQQCLIKLNSGHVIDHTLDDTTGPYVDVKKKSEF